MEKLNIFNSLLTIQEKHELYFSVIGKSVVDYLEITWQPPIFVKVKPMELPTEILDDINRLLPIS